MDPKAMEPYLDFFGFMAYDLHGFWDADVKTLGSIIRPQTDIREIDNNTLPLWFDKLDPAKVNLGLAYYGRGYTVTDRSCAYPGCPFSGPNKAGPCTGFEGVMSNREIEEIIRTKGLYPEYLREPMIKQISWDDQWIGYDDDETIRDKIALANDRCMGGTMIWSIDFDSGAGSGDVPDGGASTGGGDTGGDTSGNGTGTGSGLVLVDSSIWTGSNNPQVQCVPPCVLVLPPIPLPQVSTISFPAVTTSYLLRTTTTLNGQVVTTQITKQTVLTIAPVTTSEIELWAVTVFTDDPTSAAFTVVQSVTPSPIIVTLPASADFPPFPTATGSEGTPSKTTAPLGFTSSHAVTIQPQPTHSISIPPVPTLTFTSGKPASTCTSRCGKHTCRVFGCGGGCQLFGCGKTCGLFGCGGGPCGLFGCGGGCGVFGCGGGCGLLGCGSSNCPLCGPGPPPGGSGGGETGEEGEPDEEEDEEEEEDQKVCFLMESDLGDGSLIGGEQPPALISTDKIPTIPAPTNPSTKPTGSTRTINPSPSPRPTETNPIISPAPEPPIESPPPDPDPPAPDPSTEKKQCYDSGSWVDREASINALNSFCSRPEDADPDYSGFDHYGGHVMKDNEFIEYHIPNCLCCDIPVDIVISVQVLNGCEFEIDGPSPDQECGRILRRIIDQCDTVSGESAKQGGTVQSNCAIWRFDPGLNWGHLFDTIFTGIPCV
ncbi:MAG: hypothetical protein L6R42_001847 [Xanthoria sp. 1 TBL-2021]|nr:MAG: hypothetical protein L6R42_001847 [Xanthoria sp. 1 TBL-2021]